VVKSRICKGEMPPFFFLMPQTFQWINGVAGSGRFFYLNVLSAFLKKTRIQTFF